MCERLVGNVYLISEYDVTLRHIFEQVQPIVEFFNSKSQGLEPLYGVISQLLESPKDKIRVQQGQTSGVALIIIAIPRNLSRLCIMDENDDDDYKSIIAQARKLGAVLIAIVGKEKGEATTITPKPPLPDPHLYEPVLERIFELQPKLLPFKADNLFFSFEDMLSDFQTELLLKHLKPDFLKTHKDKTTLCIIL
eukprot:NODE_5248_length_679_cov_81.719203_g5085_i0.p1 GENE.NODE_5248_length_679_cov_81.719203_g5085_i0~~NODE_5248_length_679_cov_81.719203_g5085_i0.p1  ORF type:complete len:194 (-),score=21.51 NODE_5248_length_679_cov_81.719203_g5085_i0:22-603(-)